MTTVNFTQVLKDAKSASFEALPVGDYDVEVEKADSVTSSNGRPMIKATFKVIVGPHTNRKVINNFVLVVDNPTALAIFFRNMKAMGLADEFFASLGASGTLDPVAQSLVGRRARLKLGQREWNGEMRNEVNGVMPYTGAPGGMGGPAAGPAAGPMSAMVGTPAGPAPAPGPIAQIPTQVAQQYAGVAAAAAPTPAPAPVAATPVASPVAMAEVASAVAEVAQTVAEVAVETSAPAPQVDMPAPPALPI